MKYYIGMKSNTTKSFTTSTSKSNINSWQINTVNKYILNTTYSTRAIAFYAGAPDIRTYALGSNDPVWVWFCPESSEG